MNTPSNSLLSEDDQNEIRSFVQMWEEKILEFYLDKGGFTPISKIELPNNTNNYFKSINGAIYLQISEKGRFNGLFTPDKLFDYLYLGLEQYIKYINSPLNFEAFKLSLPFTDDQMDFYNQCFYSLIEGYKLFKQKLENPTTENYLKDLSAKEIAIRHDYLQKARIEAESNGNTVGAKYSHLKSKTNIEKAYNDITSGKLKPSREMLCNIINTLTDYPTIQKSISNDLEKIKN